MPVLLSGRARGVAVGRGHKAMKPANPRLQRTPAASPPSPLAANRWATAGKCEGRAGNQPQRGPHRHPASNPSWPAPAEIPSQETPGPSGSTASGRRKLRPVEPRRTAGVSSRHAPAGHHRPAQHGASADSAVDPFSWTLWAAFAVELQAGTRRLSRADLGSMLAVRPNAGAHKIGGLHESSR
jgi:hypothetical protein